ncbi:MAG: DNA helicase RecQ [Clostridium sp.]|uniref:DNA helicase RecQ n=1 Tax=Clostridium sp. TaxID=1506 RepID=UPI0030614798
MNDIFINLEKYFGYKQFKEGQYELISSILNKRDVLAILPTGGGKSLCYQLPGVMLSGITIVISPLISLMKDQVDNINQAGINSDFINSTKKITEINEIIDKCYNNEIKLLYIAPERLENEKFINRLRGLRISQVAVDEAHCISMWGHDFRPSYRKILPFINSLRSKPVVSAFTGTATKEVKKDILELLGLSNPYTYTLSANRPNLEINVLKEEDKLEFIKDKIKEYEEESGIIYCLTRKEVEWMYGYLRELGYSVCKYHGGLKDEEKEDFQERFLSDEINVMIATNAFGMGIDKSNIRYIIHASIPKNLECYYQEIGRAGRDGERAWCYLLYSRDDIRNVEYMLSSTTTMSRMPIELKKLQGMVDFCEEEGCYRSNILKYFGEENSQDYCNSCSNCYKDESIRDYTIEAQKILSCVYRTRESFGISVLIDVLRGFTGPKINQYKLNTLSTYGIMKEYNSKFIRDIIKTLVDLGYVSLKEGTYSMLKLNERSYKVLKGKEKVLCKLSANVEEKVINKDLFDKLRLWRKSVAFKEQTKPYIICSDSTLIELANIMPKTKEELFEIRGMGEKKVSKYGDEILNIISS